MRSKSKLLGGVLCALFFLFLISGKSFAQSNHQWHMSQNANDTGTAGTKWNGFVKDPVWPVVEAGYNITWVSYDGTYWIDLRDPLSLSDPDALWDYMQVNVPTTNLHFWGDFTYTARFRPVNALPRKTRPENPAAPYDGDVIVEIGMGITPIYIARYNDTLTYCGDDCAYVGTLIDSNVVPSSVPGYQEANFGLSVFSTCKVSKLDKVYATVHVDRAGCDNTSATWNYGCKTSTSGTVSIQVYKNGVACGATAKKTIASIPAPASFAPNQYISFGVGANRQLKEWDFNGGIDYVKFGW